MIEISKFAKLITVRNVGIMWCAPAGIRDRYLNSGLFDNQTIRAIIIFDYRAREYWCAVAPISNIVFSAYRNNVNECLRNNSQNFIDISRGAEFIYNCASSELISAFFKVFEICETKIKMCVFFILEIF